MRWAFSLVIVIAFLAAGLPDTPGRARTASAHALLVRAEPPVNAALQEPPRLLSLYFSEPLERRFSTVEVTDQDGTRLDEGVTFDDTDSTVMRVGVAPAGPGFLIVSWETVSVVDGHRIAGSYPLTILNPDGTPPAAPPPAATVEGEAPRPGLVLAKLLQLVAGAGLAGAFLFTALVASGFRRRAETAIRKASDLRTAWMAAVCLAVIAGASVLELAVQASDVGGGLANVLDTRWGERWLLRSALFGLALLAMLALVAGLRAGRTQGPAFAGFAACAGAFAAVSSTSHAAAGPGAVWATATDFVHLVAASVWIGMLAMLGLFLVASGRIDDRELRRNLQTTALQRFSVVAVVSVALLLLTGTVSAVIQVARPADLLEFAYGRALLLKLLLLVPLLAAGAYNAYVLRPAALNRRGVAHASGDASGRLAGMIRVEFAFAVAVLAVVAYLVQASPTRESTLGAEPEPFTASREVEGIELNLLVTPNLPGINAFEVSASGATDFIEQVRLEFFDRSGRASESRLVLDEVRPLAAYAGQGPFLSSAGDWQVRINLRQSQGSDMSVPFDVTVGGGPSEREGALASPLPLETPRLALIALAAAVSLALLAGSLTGGTAGGGRIGALAASLRRQHGPPGGL